MLTHSLTHSLYQLYSTGSWETWSLSQDSDPTLQETREPNKHGQNVQMHAPRPEAKCDVKKLTLTPGNIKLRLSCAVIQWHEKQTKFSSVNAITRVDMSLRKCHMCIDLRVEVEALL